MQPDSLTYLSTRGGGAALNFEQATMAGLAADGGLLVPSAWPIFSRDDLRELRALDYAPLAARIIGRFSGACVPAVDLERLTKNAYRSFSVSNQPAAPLSQLDDSLYLLELFHGPTLAFKDFALQFLGQLFGYFLSRQARACTLVGATSGDTGSAAIEAVRGIKAVTMYMLHPHGRVSEVQRRQMTTTLDDNIHNLAVDGDFDDCQNLLKALFNDAEFRQRHALAAVNSINWARICAQIVYYFDAALRLGAPEQAVNFAVPTGNFGNVFAAFAAREMGLPIRHLIIGSNSNDILTRFFESGRMARRPVNATISPSMDIQISSNFERCLFELLGRDSAQLRELMAQFAARGEFKVAPEVHQKALEVFSASRFSDDETRAEMRRAHAQTGRLLDPHSAIGVAAARAHAERHGGADRLPTIALATAHPAKFGDAVAEACGASAPLPPTLQTLMGRPERVRRVPNDLAAIQSIIDRGG